MQLMESRGKPRRTREARGHCDGNALTPSARRSQEPPLQMP